MATRESPVKGRPAPSMGKKGYGAAAMSTPNMDTLGGHGENQAKFSRSSSVGPGMTPGNLNPQQQSRRQLYMSLPFVAQFGMGKREHGMVKVASRASFAMMGLEEGGEEEVKLLTDLEMDEAIMTWPLIFAVLVAVMLEFLVGYNTGVMNAPEAVVFPGHTTTEWSLAVSVFAIGGPFGAILAGRMANIKGRRFAILLNAWVFLLGGAVLALAMDMQMIILARLIIGFASGFATVIVPIYLGELAPPTLRGTLGTMTQFSMVIGISASNLLAFPLATPSGWRVLLGVTFVLAVLQLLCAPFIFESPRWLLSKDEYSIQAQVAIKKLRGYRTDEEVQQEIDHILEASRYQKLANQSSAHSAGAVMDLLTDRRVRLLVVSFTVLHVAQQLSGINAVFYYSNSFFVGVIDNPLVGTTLVGLVNVAATYVALKLMDQTGRVTLLMWSAGGMIVCTAAVIAALSGVIPNWGALVAVMGFVSFFEIGLGPIPWLIVAEMFDAKYVATAMSVACVINWGCNFIIGIGFPFLNEYLGEWSFAPFGVVLTLTFLYTWCYLPETAGRTVQEIQKAVNVPTRGEVRKQMDRQKDNEPPEFVVIDGVDLAVN